MRSFVQLAVTMRCLLSPRRVPLAPTSLLRRAATTSGGQPMKDTSVDVADIKLEKKAGKREINWVVPQGMEDSLIPETLRKMELDTEFQITAQQLKDMGAVRLSREERQRRHRALDKIGVPTFAEFLQQQQVELTRLPTTVLQMNIGLYCNQACNHCHVESSPARTEAMDDATVDKCLELLATSPSVTTVDLTGGAPELTPQFRRIVEAVTAFNKAHPDREDVEVIDRCNLTVLMEPGQEDLAEFLALHKVRIVASLPCYSEENVDTQRGAGVFSRSIEGLRKLNSYGYGMDGSDLSLDLVYNPLGAFLPPPQAALQDKYKEELLRDFDIHFNGLFTITNMPIKRFADFLYKREELDGYMKLLVDSFNPSAAEGVMCRSHLSVGWDGHIYDCDFNQQILLHMPHLADGVSSEAPKPKVADLTSLDDLLNTDIAIGSHCFACTAGAGSSCQGATA